MCTNSPTVPLPCRLVMGLAVVGGISAQSRSHCLLLLEAMHYCMSPPLPGGNLFLAPAEEGEAPRRATQYGFRKVTKGNGSPR